MAIPIIEDMMHVDTGARDTSNIGRRLAADGLSGGEVVADGEDSPLQSKRSSMFQQILTKQHKITELKLFVGVLLFLIHIM